MEKNSDVLLQTKQHKINTLKLYLALAKLKYLKVKETNSFKNMVNISC